LHIASASTHTKRRGTKKECGSPILKGDDVYQIVNMTATCLSAFLTISGGSAGIMTYLYRNRINSFP
jgi:hypothetical protein